MNFPSSTLVLPLHEIEQEWRVEVNDDQWNALLNHARQTHIRIKKSRICDIVFGRHGFESIDKDGFIIRLRGPKPYYLEVKERLAEGVWQECSTLVDPPASALYVLHKLGLYAHLLIDRDRTVVASAGYNICFDDVVGLGKFIEVETLTSSATDDPLESLVALLAGHAKLPPYGDIVKARLQSPVFAARFKTQVQNSDFGQYFSG